VLIEVGIVAEFLTNCSDFDTDTGFDLEPNGGTH